jgi:hypothetical protein
MRGKCIPAVGNYNEGCNVEFSTPTLYMGGPLFATLVPRSPDYLHLVLALLLTSKRKFYCPFHCDKTASVA